MALQICLHSSGYSWPEAPRWARGALWISDAHNFRIATAALGEEATTVLAIPGRPAGMDFDGEGRLILASAIDRKLHDIDLLGRAARELCDLSALTSGYLNDLVTGRDGWTFVGDTGFVFGKDDPKPNGTILAYHRDKGARIVATDVFFPNGMSITPDAKTLFVSETFGKRIVAFTILEDGALTDKRVHAVLPGSPDGLCLDAAGCLWTPLLFEGKFVRLSPDGEVIDEIAFPGCNAIACTIAGEINHQLFMCVARVDNSDPQKPVRVGEVHVARAPAPSAGWPRPV